MNKRDHVLNAFLLSIGISLILSPELSWETLLMFVTVTPPIILGALFPDIDAVIGVHRKTFHNVWVLGFLLVFPYLFGNLHYVWIGVLTHFALDLLGNKYGMGLLYPLPGFYDIPVGVTVDSRWADVVTLIVTAFELGVIYLLVEYGFEAHLATPGLPEAVENVIGIVVAGV